MTNGQFAMRQMPSFAHVLARRAGETPDEVALHFRNPACELTYGQLHRKASAIAARLAEVTTPGERAVLLLPPGADYVTAFFGCLYAGVIAVPTYPPLDERQVPRLMSVVADAEPSVVLTLPDLVEFARDSLVRNGLDRPMAWVGVDVAESGDPHGEPVPDRADTVAFLQYTSGSTSNPKGTVVTHANLLDNSDAIRVLFGHSRDSRGVIWLPPYHDMGLIGGILQPIYTGFPVQLMSPLDFLASPMSWLLAVSEFRATTSGGPNFAFDLCVRKISPERREGLDLSSWAVAFCGAEPIRADTFERFVAAFEPHGFSRSALYPCYGLAESTLIAAGVGRGTGFRPCPRPPTDLSGPAPISCGSAVPGHTIEVRVPGQPAALPDGEIGEICVRGPSVALGYWQDPAATAAAFEVDGAGPRTLRTGDLGFLHGGELYVTGRLKDLVIVRGRNLPAEDLEHAVGGCHPAIRPGAVAAFEVDVAGEPGLAVLVELTTDDPEARAGVIAAVRSGLVAAFGVRPEVVLLAGKGAIPKTPSGKIRRAECRLRYLGGTLPLLEEQRTDAAPDRAGPDLGRRVADLAATVLEVVTVGVGTSLTAAGLDSLRAVELARAARETLGVELALRDLLVGATPAELADSATTARPDTGVPSADLTRPSDGERGLWLASRLSGDPDHYVLSIALDLLGPVDDQLAAQVVDLLAGRHPALRTYFPDEAGEPVRRACPRPLALRVVDLAGATEAELEHAVREHASAGIDPATGPLWRATLLHGPDASVLVLCAHHMACDVWSLDLLAGEFAEAYECLARCEQPRLAPPGDPARVAARQADRLAGERGTELAAYWRDALADLPPPGALPQARPHRRVAAPARRYRMRMPSSVVDAVHDLVRETGATPYSVLLTSFAWTLYRYTGEHRFLLGVPAAGRLDPEAAAAVGYFVNPLPFVCEIDDGADFRAHLGRVAARSAETQAHQDYPYQRIVEQVVPADRRADLIRIVLLQQQVPQGHALSLLTGDRPQPFGTLTARARFVDQRTAPFELTVEIGAAPDGFACSLIYDTEALTEPDVAAFADHWARVLAEVTTAPGLRPGEVELLTGEEWRRLVHDWNTCPSRADGPGTLPEAVFAVGMRDPGAVAVADAGGVLTYGELDRRSATLAAILAEHGAGDDEPVALLLPAGRDLVVAMLAAQRAGSPYLPLDVDNPDGRLAAILDDASAPVTVTNRELSTARADVLRGRVVLVEDAAGQDRNPPELVRHPDQLAHVIYTSGSTGTPKGVACGHRGVLNLVRDYAERAPVAPGDAVGWWTSPGFDVSVLEVFSALVAGATVQVCPPAARHDAGAVLDWLAERRVASAFLPAHLLPELADLLVHSPGRLALRRLLVGVEPIQQALLRRIAGRVPGLRIVNGYGPTETTVCATFHHLDPAGTQDGITPLGASLGNCPVYLLDTALRPVPVGAVGEIVVGGAGVARGYRGRPGLTADRFVPDPFTAGGRLYRTGDLARYRPDGQLVFLGRADQQVKVRGMRVEPREIETVLATHPAVTAAVVVADGTAPDTRLVGYARVGGARAGEPTLGAEITAYLRARLPGPMVPGTVLLVDEWPTTLNGKLDLRRLPRPEPVTVTVAPVGEVETAIAEVWAELLERPAVGRTDDFFELGGHSLLATRASAHLTARLDVPVEPCHVMDHPTVAELGALLAAQPRRRRGADLTHVLLDHIATLPDEAYRYLEPDAGEVS